MVDTRPYDKKVPGSSPDTPTEILGGLRWCRGIVVDTQPYG